MEKKKEIGRVTERSVEFLAERGWKVSETPNGEHVVRGVPCPRCGGHPAYWNWTLDKVCYRCGGNLKSTEPARIMVRREKDKDRRKANEDARHAAHLELVKARAVSDGHFKWITDWLHEKEKETFRWVGEITKRSDFDLTVDKKISGEGYYGTWVLVLFRDENGNRLKWFTNPGPAYDFEEGDRVTVKATVKDHEVYEERRETVLTRVKLIRSEALEKMESEMDAESLKLWISVGRNPIHHEWLWHLEDRELEGVTA